MKKQDKVGKVMKEYKEGTLHSGKKALLSRVVSRLWRLLCLRLACLNPRRR